PTNADPARGHRHGNGRLLDGHPPGVGRRDGRAHDQDAGGSGDLGGTMASMREIRVEKVVVNVGVGEAGEKLVKAPKVLELVTKQKSVQTLSHRAVRDWGVRRNMPIGTRVTLRGSPAETFLKSALDIRSNRLPADSFDPRGN